MLFYISGIIFLVSLVLIISSWICGLFGQGILSGGWETLTIVACIASGFCAFITFLGVALIEGVDQKDDAYRKLFDKQETHQSTTNPNTDANEVSGSDMKSE